MRGRLETLWANSERLEMLASKEPVARRQVEIYVRIRFTYYIAAVLLIFCNTRPKPAYGRQGPDWIIRPGYSFVVFSTNRGI